MHWRLSFPEVSMPYSGEKVLLLTAVPLAGANPPTHYECVGYTQARGAERPVHLICTAAELREAPRRDLIEAQHQPRGAPGMLVDVHGRTIRQLGDA